MTRYKHNKTIKHGVDMYNGKKVEVAKKMSADEQYAAGAMSGLNMHRMGMKRLNKSKKGKSSLNRASGKNEGDNMSLGKGEQPRA